MITLLRKRLWWFACIGILMVFLFTSLAMAVTITFDPGTPSDIVNGGSLVSTPGTVSIGAAATYVSGGTGLTGIATCWPSGAPCDPGGVPVSPAAAASAIDHYWLQYDPPIVFSFPSPQCHVVAVAGIDHGPLPGEALEFIVWGSIDGTNLSEQGAIAAVFDDGVDGSVGAAISGPGGSTNIGLSDDFSSVWSFNSCWSFFVVTSGDHIAGFSSPSEGEIDGLAAFIIAFELESQQADIEFSADEARDNRMDFRGDIDLGTAFGPDTVTVDIDSDSAAGVNQIDPVVIPAEAFQCIAGVCVAEVADPSQQPFRGESLNLEVTIPQSGVGEFKVQVKNVMTDVSSPPVEVTLSLQIGNRAGTDTVLEVEKDPGERLQFEKK